MISPAAGDREDHGVEFGTHQRSTTLRYVARALIRCWPAPWPATSPPRAQVTSRAQEGPFPARDIPSVAREAVTPATDAATGTKTNEGQILKFRFPSRWVSFTFSP